MKRPSAANYASFPAQLSTPEALRSMADAERNRKSKPVNLSIDVLTFVWN
ncbi:MAG: hypothetical protein JWL59_1398 [Chthoniobacteraceae bacterium]|nr:hypothetical protein [Chthoniobacteraceae bacterium]